jgi:hypothetical protein
MPTSFVAGLDLARRFYHQAVRPVLDDAMPGLPHTAALIGTGSEVLGFDTPRSTDHDWGPRVMLFLSPVELAANGGRLRELLARRLPDRFAGHPTRFAPSGAHRVLVTDLDTWFAGWLGFDPRRGIDLLDWLATPTQRLAELTGGEVFADGLGELGPARERLSWYPVDVWRYILACQWQRIAQEESFVGRCAEVGDHAGAAVVTARLVRDLLRLHLLMDRRYPPYSKWLGTAFAGLPRGDELAAPLRAALTGTGAAREERLCQAYSAAAEAHNRLGLTEPVDPQVRFFHDRPFRVLDAGRLRAALLAGIADPRVAALPPIGAIDQYADGTDLLGDIARCRAVTRAALCTATR